MRLKASTSKFARSSVCEDIRSNSLTLMSLLLSERILARTPLQLRRSPMLLHTSAGVHSLWRSSDVPHP
jgi:hypothetical protein